MRSAVTKVSSSRRNRKLSSLTSASTSVSTASSADALNGSIVPTVNAVRGNAQRIRRSAPPIASRAFFGITVNRIISIRFFFHLILCDGGWQVNKKRADVNYISPSKNFPRGAREVLGLRLKLPTSIGISVLPLGIVGELHRRRPRAFDFRNPDVRTVVSLDIDRVVVRRQLDRRQIG